MTSRFEFWFMLIFFVVLPLLQWIAKKLGEVGSKAAESQAKGAAQRDASVDDPWDADANDDWEIVEHEDTAVAEQTRLAEERARADRSASKTWPRPVESTVDVREFLRQMTNASPVVRQPSHARPPAPPPAPKATATPSPVMTTEPSTHAYDVRSEVHLGAYASEELDSAIHAGAYNVREAERRIDIGPIRRRDLRRMIVWKEILDKPVGLRDHPPGSMR